MIGNSARPFSESFTETADAFCGAACNVFSEVLHDAARQIAVNANAENSERGLRIFFMVIKVIKWRGMARHAPPI
jgi:hypothetical protein